MRGKHHEVRELGPTGYTAWCGAWCPPPAVTDYQGWTCAACRRERLRVLSADKSQIQQRLF